MPFKTITKIAAFVILSSFASVFSACENFTNGRGNASSTDKDQIYSPPQIIGKITSNEIQESSGLAASKCRSDILWTHNDSGGGPFLYAIDVKGARLETWQVTGAKNIDWEDIALRKDTGGKCYLYIGDIGNNTRQRGEFSIYRIAEPSASPKSTSRKMPGETAAAEILRFSYPDNAHDAETLLVEPVSGSIYVITKRISDSAGVYKLKPDFSSDELQIAEKIDDISVPAIPNGFLTGGDISPDGKRVVLCDYFSGYELSIKDGQSFDEIWTDPPVKFGLGKREQGESITYSPDGNSVFATSELKNSPLIKVSRISK